MLLGHCESPFSGHGPIRRCIIRSLRRDTMIILPSTGSCPRLGFGVIIRCALCFLIWLAFLLNFLYHALLPGLALFHSVKVHDGTFNFPREGRAAFTVALVGRGAVLVRRSGPGSICGSSGCRFLYRGYKIYKYIEQVAKTEKNPTKNSNSHTGPESSSWSINQSINPSINRSINQSINRPINQSIDLSIDQTNQSTGTSLNYSINRLVQQIIKNQSIKGMNASPKYWQLKKYHRNKLTQSSLRRSTLPYEGLGIASLQCQWEWSC